MQQLLFSSEFWEEKKPAFTCCMLNFLYAPSLLTLVRAWRWEAGDFLLTLSSKKNRCGKVAATNHLVKKGFWTHFNNKSSNKQYFSHGLELFLKTTGRGFLEHSLPNHSTTQEFRGLKQLQEVPALSPSPRSQAAFGQGNCRTCKSFQALRRHQPWLFPSGCPFHPNSSCLLQPLTAPDIPHALSFTAFQSVNPTP